MKIFLSYKFSGENKESLNSLLAPLIEFLRSCGYNVYCSLEQADDFVSFNLAVGEIIMKIISDLCNSDSLQFTLVLK